MRNFTTKAWEIDFTGFGGIFEKCSSSGLQNHYFLYKSFLVMDRDMVRSGLSLPTLSPSKKSPGLALGLFFE